MNIPTAVYWQSTHPCRTLMKHLPIAAALAMALATCAPARAADAATEAIQAAYAPYRVALFRTNGQSQPEAQKAIDQAQQAWQGVIERFAARPPVPYDRDPAFADTLREVAAVYDKAGRQIQAGQLTAAHDTLEAARDLLAALRQRNGVVVFSDAMNAYHAEMEHLLIQGPAMLAGPQGLPRFTAQVGVLDYLARQLRAQAPASLRQNAEFDALLKDLETSVQPLLQAALAQDAAALGVALGRLKPAYSKLFMKFG
jgi:hypothetical protein